MNLISTPLRGLYVAEPIVHKDQRGYFFESFQKQKFLPEGKQIDFVQDNESMSDIGVLRGLHYQIPPFSQGKLVRVIKGSVLDVAVDIRKSSPTFGQHFSLILSAENKKMLWIPPGFAHGFLTLENQTIFFYKCTQFYEKSSERGIRWNDPVLNIQWGIEQPLVSKRDGQLPFLSDISDLF